MPGIAALATALLLAAATLVLGAIASLSDIRAVPASRMRWLEAGPTGECVLAGAALVITVLGLLRPAWRHRAAIGAALIIPVAMGWLLLTGLLGGSVTS